MKKISQGLTGQIFLFYIISFVFIPFVMADEIAKRLIESNPICSPEIQIQLNLAENQLSCAIEENIPTGLIPSNISHNGVWDSETRRIKWGLFNNYETINLYYQLTGIKSTIQLNGNISIDGIDQFITGDSTVSIDCMPEKEQLSSPVFDPPGGSLVPVNCEPNFLKRNIMCTSYFRKISFIYSLI